MKYIIIIIHYCYIININIVLNITFYCSRQQDSHPSLQMDLTSTREEKKVIDESLIALKQNLKVVEQNFHAMKDDLIGKTEELDATKKLLKEKFDLDEGDGHLKDILSDSFKFLAPPPHRDRPCQTASTQTPGGPPADPVDNLAQEISLRLREEKEDCETKLFIMVEQLKASQERHKHQLNSLYAVECELEEAKKEVDSLREKVKTLERNTTEDVLVDNSLRKSEQINLIAINGDKFTTQSQVALRRPEIDVDHSRVQCSVQGKCSTAKVIPTHLEGLDLRDAMLTSNDDVDVVNGPDYGEVIVNRVSSVENTNSVTDGDLKSAPKMATNEMPLHHLSTECIGDCQKSLDLQKQLVDLQQKLFKAEQRSLSAEEQRNKVTIGNN